MSDVVTSARTARERLAQGLGALQGPGVPEQLMHVAEPIARAMSALHQVESTNGQTVVESGPIALNAVRTALGILQSQAVNHPSVEAALEAVAGSLGLVHRLVQITSAPPPPAAAAASAPAPTRPLAAPAVPSPEALGMGGQQPNYGAKPQSPYGAAAVPAAAPFPSQQNAFAPSSTLQSHGAEKAGPGQAGSSYKGEATQPEAKPLPAAVPNQLRLEAALGAHSPTNFYKGLSGNDVVDAGGIFIATYQIPRIGTPLLLKISLPGGYEFDAQAVVRWTREPSSISEGASPGFGAQFTSISSEGRQLVYRYVRNREPLFHDDL